MAILTITGSGNVGELRLRLQMAQAAIGLVVPTVISQAGQYVADELKIAAPQGSSSGDAPPIEGDAPGHLADSFEQQMLASTADYAATQVITTQPRKLGFVVRGHGEVVPVNKRALMWQGLAHPVRKAKAVAPNDFVTPVLEAGVAQAVALLEEAITTEVLSIVGG
jgi:hypothetical protein